MKIIEVDDELYQYIASKTENIGEQASDILRRLLGFSPIGESRTVDSQAQSSEAQGSCRDEEIEVVIPAELAMAKDVMKNAAQKIAQIKADSGSDSDAGKASDYGSDDGSAEQDESEQKTTTVKAQQAKHTKISAQADLEPSTDLTTNTEPTKLDEESVAAEQTPAKTIRKLKTRRSPKAKPGPTDEQFAAPVNGLDLSNIKENNTIVGRFLYILSRLEQKHQADFKQVLEIQGKGRLYFATSKQALSEAGSNTNPKQIGKSTYWVMTNSNTARKKQMLSEVGKVLGYKQDSIETLMAKL